MLNAGESMVRAWLPGLKPSNARDIAEEVYAAMAEAAPKKVDMQPKPVATLTPLQAVYYNLLWELTDELGRFPSTRELAARAGQVQQAAYMRLKFLRQKGFVKVNRKGRIRWLKPRQ